LKYINTPDINIITLEDPVEYRMPTVRQVQLNRKAGMTFASGLRSILRQDPDVILVGEVRDAETAEIAVQAALTGHRVLTTLHTNDAAQAITRLIERASAYLVSSVLLACEPAPGAQELPALPGVLHAAQGSAHGLRHRRAHA
jgi:type IV pilus assembly protein PilB